MRAILKYLRGNYKNVMETSRDRSPLYRATRLFSALCVLCVLCGLISSSRVEAAPKAEAPPSSSSSSSSLAPSSPTSASPEATFLARAKSAYEAASQSKSTNANKLQASIDLARTAFDYADLAPNDSIRETTANAGIAAAHEALGLRTNSAPAHYYLALNISQLARTKKLRALRLLDDMEAELKTVIQLDPKFDYAGGDRTISALYLEAPGWPLSLGSKSKARAHLTQALALAPEFPDNHLSFMEALSTWNEPKALQERIAAYKSILPAAKTNFTGADWENEWYDWTRRFEKIQDKNKKASHDL